MDRQQRFPFGLPVQTLVQTDRRVLGIGEERQVCRPKADKTGAMQKYKLNLVELTDDDIKNLDDMLPKMLKVGVEVS